MFTNENPDLAFNLISLNGPTVFLATKVTWKTPSREYLVSTPLDIFQAVNGVSVLRFFRLPISFTHPVVVHLFQWWFALFPKLTG
jgi:hypothetical protein